MPFPFFSDKKSGWLILWKTSTEEYLKKIDWPRIVALLDHWISEAFIESYLRLLHATEQRFGHKSVHFKMESHLLKSGWRETLTRREGAIRPPMNT